MLVVGICRVWQQNQQRVSSYEPKQDYPDEMLITVGITTYRRLEYLKEAVESALNQRFSGFEVLISQNPHPDMAVSKPIEMWCRQLAERDARVRYRSNRKNIGVAENVNAIADDARGEFLMQIGDDDRILPNGLESLSKYAGRDVDVVFANHTVIDARGLILELATEQIEVQFGRAAIETGPLSQIDAEKASWNVSIALAAALIRTKVFRDFRYKSNLTKGDTELFIRLAREGKRFFFCNDYVSAIRHHRNQASESIVGFVDLVLELADLEVRPELELKKRAAMKHLTRQGVSDALLHNRVTDARRLIASPYYRRFSSKGVLQLISAFLPASMGKPLFRYVYKLYCRFSGLRYEDQLGLETLQSERDSPE